MNENTRKILVSSFKQAESWIRLYPERYDVLRIDVPIDQTRKACFLGWIAWFTGYTGGDAHTFAEEYLETHSVLVYTKMAEIDQKLFCKATGLDSEAPEAAAKMLRLYREKYLE